MGTSLIGQLDSANPKVLAFLSSLLNKKLPEPKEPEVVVGLMTSGVVLSAFLALARGSKFNYSVHDLFGSDEDVMKFSEKHRNDKLHYLYGIKSGGNVVIIEDEIWTGEGIIQLAEALREYGAKVSAVATIIEILNFGAKQKIIDKTGLEIKSLVKTELIK